MITPIITSVKAVIKELGGPHGIADTAGVGVTAVYNWIERDRIASDKFLLIHQALEKRGKAVLPELFGLKVKH